MYLQIHIKKYAIVLIAVVGIISYINSFNNAFQFDDGYHILEGSKIKDIHNFTDLSHWKNIENRPLSFFTLAVDYSIAKKDSTGKPKVTGFHITNFIFHILASFISFLLCFEIMSLAIFDTNQTIKKYSVFIALFASFIFVAHPIQTQAVTYIVQRMAVMAGLFYMLSVLLYIKGRKIHIKKIDNWKPYLLYSLSFIAGILGFLSKQNALTFPLACILAEIFFIRNVKEEIDKKFLAFFASFVTILFFFGLLYKGLPVEYPISRWEYLLTQFRVLVKYWQLIFVPINQHVDYYFTLSTTLWDLEELISLAFLIGTILFSVFLFKRQWYIVSFSIFWFYVTLSIESSIIPIRDFIVEHRLYIALLGYSFSLSYVIFYFLGRKRMRYPLVVLSVVTVIYVGLSINRNIVWSTPYTLWADSVTKSPKRERGWYWLALYYRDNKDIRNSLRCYNIAIECNPSFTLAYNGRGNVKVDIGDFQGALDDYNTAIRLDPKYAIAYYNRGIAYSNLNRLQEAIQDYNRSIALGNASADVYFNRANAKRQNKEESFLNDYDRAIEIDPLHSTSYFNRGMTRAKLGDYQKALEDITISIKIDPKNYLYYNGKGLVLNDLKQYTESVENFTLCIQLNPKFGSAYYHRGSVKQSGLKDTKGACKDWERALAQGHQGAGYYLENLCK
jgi:protein O-mannosyl-transferase